MNRDRLIGQLQQLAGRLKETWGHLTGAPACVDSGRQAQFAGRIRAQRGLSAERAERQLSEFLYRHRDWKITKITS